MKIKRTREEFKSLAKISSKCSLVNIFLLNCSVERAIDATSHQKINAQIEANGSLLRKEVNSFTAKATLTVMGLMDGNKDDHVVKITGEYMLSYKLAGDLEIGKDELENFCGINALYNAWPFFREFVLSMSNRMDIPPLVLPLLSIAPESTRNKEGDEVEKDPEGKD